MKNRSKRLGTGKGRRSARLPRQAGDRVCRADGRGKIGYRQDECRRDADSLCRFRSRDRKSIAHVDCRSFRKLRRRGVSGPRSAGHPPRLLKGGPMVLSTGGGAFMQDRVRANIKRRGLSLWLKADLDVLWDRVKRRSHRPLLKTQNPKGTLSDLLESRYPVYGEADLIIQSRDVPKETIVGEVIDAIIAAGPVQAEEERRAKTMNSKRHSCRRQSRQGGTRRPFLRHPDRAGPDPVRGRTDRSTAAGHSRGHRQRRDGGGAASAGAGRKPQRGENRAHGHRAARRGENQELRAAGGDVGGGAGGAARAGRCGDCAGRRRDWRSRRVRIRHRAPRHALHPGADIAAGAGRFLGRRQDRHQFSPTART